MKRANVKLQMITDDDLRALKAMQADRDLLARLEPYDQDGRIPAEAVRVSPWWWRAVEIGVWIIAVLAVLSLWLKGD